jgi:hypothetical protein
MTSMLSSATSAAAADAADALVDARVVKDTKRQYENRLKLIDAFYRKVHGCPLTVPVELTAIRKFFGWFTDEKHKEKPAAFSTVRQYKSALLWLYKEKEVVLQPEVDQGIETLLSGYKRKVSDFKLAGKMPVFEGKYHLTYEGYWVITRGRHSAAGR